MQFPGGQAGTLQKWAGFVGQHANGFTAFYRRPDHSQRGAVATGGQSAGIAVGQHPCAVGDQLRPMAPHGAVDGDVIIGDGLGLVQQGGFDLGQGVPRQFAGFGFHAVKRPEQVNRCGAGCGEGGADLLQFGIEGFEGIGIDIARTEGRTEGRGHADGGRSAYDHGLYRLGNGSVVAVFEPQFLAGQKTLVDHANHAVMVFDRLYGHA